MKTKSCKNFTFCPVRKIKLFKMKFVPFKLDFLEVFKYEVTQPFSIYYFTLFFAKYLQ